MVVSHLIEVFNAVLDSLNRFLEHVVITIKDFERNQSLVAVFEGLLRVQVCHQRLLTAQMQFVANSGKPKLGLTEKLVGVV